MLAARQAEIELSAGQEFSISHPNHNGERTPLGFEEGFAFLMLAEQIIVRLGAGATKSR
jgi:hypothetical protein